MEKPYKNDSDGCNGETHCNLFNLTSSKINLSSFSENESYIIGMGDKMKKITIKDIAKEAELSIGAVSLILNNKPCRVAQEKKDRVKAIAQSHNYIVNQAARSLVTNSTKTLALIIPDIENVFFSALSKIIEERCRKSGYTLLIANSNDLLEEDAELIRIMDSRGIDGLFLILSNEAYENKPRVDEILQKMVVPYVMVDRTLDEYDCDKVCFDNELGAFLAVSYLIESGHQKIGCIANSRYSNNGKQRLLGYKKALLEHHLPINEDYIVEGNYRFNGGYEAAKKLVNCDVTAVFSCNDMMALGYMKYIYEQGLRIPEDYSLVSYDNQLYHFNLGVALSAIEQNVEELGLKACDLLIKRIQNPEGEKANIMLKPKLVLKESVKQIKGRE